jgi:hypothetical protein
MKKVTFILAFGAMLALIACGSGSTANQTTDSAAVYADTTAVVDTTSVPVEGGVAPVEEVGGTEKPVGEAVK